MNYLRLSLCCFAVAIVLAWCGASWGYWIDEDTWLGGVAWQFRDEFTTDATALNNTASEPGPGTRVEVDSANHLSISGGNLVADGGAGAGDPALFNNTAITRAAGKLLLWSPTVTDVTQTVEWGFDTNTVDGIGENALRITGDMIKPYLKTVAGPTVYVPADNTATPMAIALRSVGAYYFVKSGTTWKLVWLSNGATENTATLYAGISNTNAAFTSPWLRQPKSLWIPSPIVSDGMN